MEFKDVLKSARESKGFTQNKLAELTGYSRMTITMWELGTREPSLYNADTILKYLGVSMTIGEEK